MAGSSQNDSRPLSPHIMNWKWHITMATSILHRATGVALYIGAFVIVAWLVALAMSSPMDTGAYDTVAGLLGSIPGQVVLFGFTAAVMYHLANGVRHLIWDAGVGYAPGTANFSAWLTILFAAFGSVGIWAAILLL